MDNVFFQFCKKYWADIVAFFDSLYAMIKKLADPTDSTTEAAE